MEISVLAKDWGNRLKARREAMGWTQVFLARIVDSTQSQISAFEKGHVVPSDAWKLRLSGAMGAKVSELFPWPDVVLPMPKPRTARKAAA